jgi:16S rRNA processing protein RimM
LTAAGHTTDSGRAARDALGRADGVQAGVVGRPHGLQGAFYVNRALVAMLSVGSLVSVAGHSRRVTRRAGTERRPILALAGVEDRDAAAQLRGQPLIVARQDAPVLGEDEWWAHELEGCEVFAAARHIGTVTRVIALPSCEALEVRSAERAGGSLLVPMVKDAVREVRPQERRIEVDADFLAEALPTSAPARGGERGD